MFTHDGENIICDWEADGYRLPSEAEWQFACKAGTTGYRYGELDKIAWYNENLPVSHVVPHRHWTGKVCPSRILPRWSEFVEMVQKEMKAMDKLKQPGYVGHWAEASIRRVMDAGIMSGRGNGFTPNEPITRAEMAVIADCILKQMQK